MGFILPVRLSRHSFPYSARLLCLYSVPESCLTVTPWTVAHKASLSMEFSRQEYWSELPFPTPGDLLDLGIEPKSLGSLALIGRFLITEPPGKPLYDSK